METKVLNVKSTADLDGIPKDSSIRIKLKLEEKSENIIGIAEWIKQPVDIEEIIFCIDSRTTHEYLQILLDGIREHNNIYPQKNIQKLTIECASNDGLNDNMKNLCNLFSPTQDFQFRADHDSLLGDGMDVMFAKLIEVLQSGTNFNQFSISNSTLFGGYLDVNDFKDFAAFIIDHNWPIKKLEFENMLIRDLAFPIFIQLIERSPTLVDLGFELMNSTTKIDGWIDAIANSNIKRLTMLQQSDVDPLFGIGICQILKKLTSLEHLNLTMMDVNISDEDIIEAIKDNQSIRTLSIYPPGTLTSLVQKWLPTNESITHIIYQQSSLAKEVQEQIAAITSRNKNLRNERIKSTIVLLYNLARFNTSNATNNAMPRLPNEIWILIASYFKYPAVTVNFSSIARLIFKDQSIRRVC